MFFLLLEIVEITSRPQVFAPFRTPLMQISCRQDWKTSVVTLFQRLLMWAEIRNEIGYATYYCSTSHWV